MPLPPSLVPSLPGEEGGGMLAAAIQQKLEDETK
jgi:hypothetical protein